jgi:hypothetical protein
MDDFLIFGNFLGKSHFRIQKMEESEYLFYEIGNRFFKKTLGKYFGKIIVPDKILRYVQTEEAILFMLGEK